MRYGIITFALNSYHSVFLYMCGRLLIYRIGGVAGNWYLIGAMAHSYSFSKNIITFKDQLCKDFANFYL